MADETIRMKLSYDGDVNKFKSELLKAIREGIKQCVDSNEQKLRGTFQEMADRYDLAYTKNLDKDRIFSLKTYSNILEKTVNDAIVLVGEIINQNISSDNNTKSECHAIFESFGNITVDDWRVNLNEVFSTVYNALQAVTYNGLLKQINDMKDTYKQQGVQVDDINEHTPIFNITYFYEIAFPAFNEALSVVAEEIINKAIHPDANSTDFVNITLINTES